MALKRARKATSAAVKGKAMEERGSSEVERATDLEKEKETAERAKAEKGKAEKGKAKVEKAKVAKGHARGTQQLGLSRS